MIIVAALLIALLIAVAVVGAVGVLTLVRSILSEIRQKAVVPETASELALAHIATEEVASLARRRGIPAPEVTVVSILGQPVTGSRVGDPGTGGLAATRVLRRHGQPALVLLAGQASRLSREALQSLLAHELAHAERYSTQRARSRMYAVRASWMALPALAGSSAAIGAHRAGATAAFSFAVVTTMTAGLAVLAIAQAYARHEELAADRYAIALTDNLDAAAELMSIYEQSRSASSISILDQVNRLFASHPEPCVRLAKMHAQWSSSRRRP